MRRFVLLLASAALAVLVASGVAGAAYAEEPILDQENDPPALAGYTLANFEHYLAQTFTVGQRGRLHHIELYISHEVTGSGGFRATVCKLDSSGLNSESCQNSGVEVSPESVGDDPQWIPVPYGGALQPGEEYAIILRPQNSNGLLWGTSADTYPGGQNYERNLDEESSTREWQPLHGDFLFRTYVIPDDTPPVGTVQINNGARRTTTRTVTLALQATDEESGTWVSSMRIKNAGGTWSAWQLYVQSKDWKLTRGAGKKAVYVQYRDAAGNVSVKASDSITYRP